MTNTSTHQLNVTASGNAVKELSAMARAADEAAKASTRLTEQQRTAATTMTASGQALAKLAEQQRQANTAASQAQTRLASTSAPRPATAPAAPAPQPVASLPPSSMMASASAPPRPAPPATGALGTVLAAGVVGAAFAPRPAAATQPMIEPSRPATTPAMETPQQAATPRPVTPPSRVPSLPSSAFTPTGIVAAAPRPTIDAMARDPIAVRRDEQARQMAALAQPTRPRNAAVSFLEELQRRGTYDYATPGKAPGVADVHRGHGASKRAAAQIGPTPPLAWSDPWATGPTTARPSIATPTQSPSIPPAHLASTPQTLSSARGQTPTTIRVILADVEGRALDAFRRLLPHSPGGTPSAPSSPPPRPQQAGGFRDLLRNPIGSLAGPLGVGAAAIYGADRAGRGLLNNYMSGWRDRNGRLSGEKFGEWRDDAAEKVPLLGMFVTAGKMGSKRDFEEQRIKEANTALARQQALAPLYAQRDWAIPIQQARMITTEQARQRYAVPAMGQIARGTVDLTHWEERQLAAAGKTRGYGREAEQADIGRVTGFHLAHQVQQVEQGVSMRSIEAEKAMAAKQEQALTGKLQHEQGVEKQERGRLLSTQNDRQYEEQLLRVKQQQLTVEQTQGMLQEARAHRLALERQHADALLQAAQQRLGLLRQEHAAASQVIQQERQRQQGMKENFGLAMPHERRLALHVAKKVSAGKDLTYGELGIAKQHQDLFGESLKKIGDKRAGGEWDQIRQLLRVDEREKQAIEQRLAVEQKITIEIKQGETSVSEAGARVMGEINRLQKALTDGIAQMLLRQTIEAKQQRVPGVGK